MDDALFDVDDLLDAINDRSVATYVAAHLSEISRPLGRPFSDAWRRALVSAPRGEERSEWMKALRWAKPAYHAWYEGLPAPVAEQVSRTESELVPEALAGRTRRRKRRGKETPVKALPRPSAGRTAGQAAA